MATMEVKDKQVILRFEKPNEKMMLMLYVKKQYAFFSARVIVNSLTLADDHPTDGGEAFLKRQKHDIVASD